MVILFYPNVQGGDGMFGGDGFPVKEFPNGWKGPHGLYGVGFGKMGIRGCAHDAVLVAKDIAKVETRINPDIQTFSPWSNDREMV
jgi:hypothetical protein